MNEAETWHSSSENALSCWNDIDNKTHIGNQKWQPREVWCSDNCIFNIHMKILDFMAQAITQPGNLLTVPLINIVSTY